MSGGEYWIVDVLTFQKIFSLCGLKGHIVEIRGGVKLVDNGRRRTTECEGRARILGGRIRNLSWVSTTFSASERPRMVNGLNGNYLDKMGIIRDHLIQSLFIGCKEARRDFI